MALKRMIPPLIGLVCAILAFAQSPEKGPTPVPSQRSETLRVNVDIVLVSATVTDSQGRYITGLQKENFKIFEDKIEQEVQYFSAEQVPLSVGVVFDVSGSMSNKLSAARDAAVTFMRIGGTEDEYFLVEFSDSAQITHNYTSDIARLQHRIAFAHAKGSTALYDAMYLALSKVDQGNNARKALLLITDGQDNHSRYSLSNVKEYAKERNVQIFGIGILDPPGAQFGDSNVGRGPIQNLADITGGRAFFPDSPHQLEAICTQIAVDLKNQYVLGYRSTNASQDGKWRKIKVQMNRSKSTPRLNVRAKSGYYASALMKAMK